MAAARLVVILALASLLATQAAETRPSFVEWITQGSGKVQSAYEEVEKESTCLQTTGVRNCRCHNEVTLEGQDHATCVGEYTEVKLACCESSDGDKYSRTVEELIAEKHSVGVCRITQHFFKTNITYERTEAVKIGTFTGECTLGEKSSQCGSPLCEGMILVLQGDILRYGKVGFIHSLAQKNIEGDCQDVKYLPPDYTTAAPDAKKKTPAKVEYSKGGAGGVDAPKFLVGQGDIYAGTFTVVSPHHKTPYKVGTYQAVTSTGAPGSYEEVNDPATVNGCYVAKDGAAALDFLKSGGNY